MSVLPSYYITTLVPIELSRTLMCLRTLSAPGWTRNLRLRHFSNSVIRTHYEYDLSDSPLLKSVLGQDVAIKEELKLGLPNRYNIISSKFHVNGLSSHEIQVLGHFKKHDYSYDLSYHIETENGQTHWLRDRPRRKRETIERVKVGDLIFAKGHLAVYQTIVDGTFEYIPPIIVTDLYIVGDHKQCDTFSSALLFGRVLGRYSALLNSRYAGQINLMTWLNNWSDKKERLYVQTNRIFISEKTLGLFPFITQLEDGEHLMVTGSLDYFKHPSVVQKVVAINAQQIMRVDRMYAEKEGRQTN